MYAIDADVVIDVGTRQPRFWQSSTELLEKMQGSGLCICPVVYVQIAPTCNGNLERIESFLRMSGIEVDPFNQMDQRLAAQTWSSYALRRKLTPQDLREKRPAADLIIGAHAMRHEGLITRNERHFERIFPLLNLVTPEKVR